MGREVCFTWNSNDSMLVIAPHAPTLEACQPVEAALRALDCGRGGLPSQRSVNEVRMLCRVLQSRCSWSQPAGGGPRFRTSWSER